MSDNREPHGSQPTVTDRGAGHGSRHGSRIAARVTDHGTGHGVTVGFGAPRRGWRLADQEVQQIISYRWRVTKSRAADRRSRDTGHGSQGMNLWSRA